MVDKARGKYSGTLGIILVSFLGGFAGILVSILLTFILSLLQCLGLHPEAAMIGEWSSPISALMWSGYITRSRGRTASIGSGLVVGLSWMGAWLYLIGRFSPYLWVAEGSRELRWPHLLAWGSAPVLSFIGGEIAFLMRKSGRLARLIPHISLPVIVAACAFISAWSVDSSRTFSPERGVTIKISGPDSQGNTVRFFTFDFNANPKLKIGIYDRDSDDSHPFDNINTSFFGTPALAVYDKLKQKPIMLMNAGFYCWTEPGFVGSHVAPMVIDGKAHYNVSYAPHYWTWGWKTINGRLKFRLLKDIHYKQLTDYYDNAFGHVAPLVVDHKPMILGNKGPGRTWLCCSRASVGWAEDSSKMYVLIVRGRDGERASADMFMYQKRQNSGWNLPQVRSFWLKQGVRQAIALDGGDSTQIVYSGSRGKTAVSSGRLAFTFGYIMDKPFRCWIPIMPMRHSHVGVMNYLYVTR